MSSNGSIAQATDPRQAADPGWFVDARFGMFIHWGLYALAARHEWIKRNERMDDARYQRYFEHFEPDRYDPREWARQAREAGMRYVVLTSKHHEGFCLWDSAETDYCAAQAPLCRRDLLAEFVDAFRAEGLRIGLYYSLLDWHHPDFTVDKAHPLADDPAARAGNDTRDMRRYAAYMRAQVEELLTGYGPIDLLWFDFSYPGPDGKGRDDWESERLLQVVKRHQPQALINNRLDLPGIGDFVTPEQFQPASAPLDEQGHAVVWEACHTFSGSWGYHRDEQGWKSSEQLIGMLVDSVSKGGNLLLNVGPTARGAFDHRASERLQDIGDWMRHSARSIYGCGPAPADLLAPQDCRYTYNATTGRLYLHCFAWPFRHLHLPGMAGRVRYAQLLQDGSELPCECMSRDEHDNTSATTPAGHATVTLPTRPPEGPVPVIELFLTEDAVPRQ